MAELKPCPFCGGAAKYISKRNTDYLNAPLKGKVICLKCGAGTKEYLVEQCYGAKVYTERQICNKWNRRVEDD